jgi:hypothetical protein
MKFRIELLSSHAAQFACVGNDVTAAESYLIAQLSPCFNRASNAHPAPLPERYAPPSGPLRCSRNLNHLIREAGRALEAERRKRLLDEIA